MKALLKITAILFLAITLFSCKNDNLDLAKDNSIITFKEGSGFSSEQTALLKKEFLKIDIFKKIKDMKNFTVTEDEILNKKFIQGEGVDENGNHVVFRTAVKIKQLKNGDSQIALDDVPNGGETCTGVNCSKCSFASGGGCDCDKVGDVFGGASYCNHSISSGGNPDPGK